MYEKATQIVFLFLFDIKKKIHSMPRHNTLDREDE